ncbi:wax ester/triacylglycerol synthase family O-acyltransferase [Massilia sp. W12]|uniref:wax ester/triacylglycerol synthase family O-acyltransferase n=1 Tax=Massilia sp. W12 TaxID=3126507 RepID=UPI0030CD207A
MIPVSSSEELLMRLENANMPMHVSSLTIYDPGSAPGGKVGFKDIMRFFSERLYRSKVFRHKLAPGPLGLGNGFWVEDPEFDIEFHLRHIALPKPGDWRQFCIQVARLHARHLDTSRPLWECYVIEGLDNIPGVPKGSFALFMKTHYAAMHGAPGAQLLAALHELSPDARASAPKQGYAHELPGMRDMLMASASNSLRWPLRVAHYMNTYFSPLKMYAGGKLGEWLRPWRRNAEQSAPPTPFNAPVSPHRVFEAVNIDLPQIARVRELVEGANSNDVLICVIAGALRQYLGGKGLLPPASLLAEAPFTSRSEMRINSMRKLADSAVMALHTDCADPLQRLRQIVAETRHGKQNFQSFLGKRLLLDATDLAPSVLIKGVGEAVRRSRLASHLPPQFNTSISSMRGPDLPLYMSGARLVSYYGMDLVHDLSGLSHMICYFAGQASISVTACRKLLPDPAAYAACLQQSWQELLQACQHEDAAPAPAPKRRRVRASVAGAPPRRRKNAAVATHA